MHDDVFAAQPAEIIPFLKRVLPFSELDDATLAALARTCTIDFQPKGTRLLTQGKTTVEHLLIIQRGGVKLYLMQEQGEDRLVDYRGEGGIVGALGIIRNAPASLTADTIEDTFVFRMPAAEFRRLVETHPAVSRHFLKNLSEHYVSRAFSELRRQHADLCADSPLTLFSTRLGDIVHREPLAIESGRSVRDAAAIMMAEGIGSLLVTAPDGSPAGIVTDKDLRRAVAEGEDPAAPVEFIMSAPLVTASHRDMCFDALLSMMARQIHHLAVLREGRVTGMVTSHDIMVLQGRSPVSLFREIVAQRTLEGLHPLSQKVPLVVGSLIEEGAKAGNITRMITVLNDLILEKLLTMLQDRMGPPPVPFCWMLMGSEGRREQTFHTDQDNALIHGDPADAEEAARAEAYFAAFSAEAIEHLGRCGYPPCPGGMMASNPQWRMPFARFRDFFEGMLILPEPREVLNATIFFDFRPGYGHTELGEALRRHVTAHASREGVFLRHLARDCLAARPPLSFFRSFIVEKDGEHKDTLDLKTRGLVPFVDFARLFALRHAIAETNTLDRLHLLAEGGHIAADLASEAAEAYEFLMQLRLVHQMRQIREGREPDNRVRPDALSELEKKTLKEAFTVISGLQGFIRDVFRLNVA
ncbi:CBS domain-containing protein [Desulfobaculum xiamenense]|uniref:CBS domain-containing protein n=1 Tax=Desulfobaculum xiamenense TaxID=995050 RepID=A0A846QLM0_9BACT|nr:putative nucleotidyltransferase substrate binding domain-containing protein [Desulfobaculum xiamenense]NJB68087.1 CBS domain-containing protein [Desulfobaculum xiamenense]